jgi:hypothetical protein
MSGTLLPRLHTSLWCGAHLDTEANLPYILWHVDRLMGNGWEINIEQPLPSNGFANKRVFTSKINLRHWGMKFSVWSVPRSYEQARDLMSYSRCELLLWEAGIWGRGQFGNPEEGERPPLEAGTKQRLVRTSLWTLVCVCVTVGENCIMRSFITCTLLLV